MSGGFVAVLVLAGIALLRAKYGDESYEKFVIRFFAWLFGSVAVGFVGLYVYGRLFN